MRLLRQIQNHTGRNSHQGWQSVKIVFATNLLTVFHGDIWSFPVAALDDFMWWEIPKRPQKVHKKSRQSPEKVHRCHNVHRIVMKILDFRVVKERSPIRVIFLWQRKWVYFFVSSGRARPLSGNRFCFHENGFDLCRLERSKFCFFMHGSRARGPVGRCSTL